MGDQFTTSVTAEDAEPLTEDMLRKAVGMPTFDSDLVADLQDAVGLPEKLGDGVAQEIINEEEPGDPLSLQEVADSLSPLVPKTIWERPKVMLSTLCTQTVTTAMAHHTAMLCLEDGGKTIMGQTITHTARSYQGRNRAIEIFLESDADVLLWIDSDMTFDLNAYYRLLDAQEHHRITTALAFIYTGSAVWPNIFFWDEERKSYMIDHRYNPGSEFYVDATGVAFTMVHRSVYEELNEHGLEGRWHEDHVEHYLTGQEMGHDISFFHEARTKIDTRPWYITSAKTGHVKVGEINEGAFHAFIASVQGLPPDYEPEQTIQ